MLTATQAETRRTGIGGSDAAAAVGLSRWGTPLEVYLEKRGELPAFEGNRFTDWGNRLEPVIRQKYSDETGREVRLPEETMRHQAHGFMLCHPDGVALRPNSNELARLFEAKNTQHEKGWGEAGTDEIPEEHLIQVQHNMLVTGLPVADVAVLIGGSDFRIYEVPADAELQALLIQREGELWSRIERGDPPPVTTVEDARLLYGRSSIARRVEADDELYQAWCEMLDFEDQGKVLEEMVEHRKAQIMAALGESDTLVRGRDILVTYKLDAKGIGRLDSAALRAAHPEIADAFTKVSPPVRRFLPKRGNR